MKESEAVTTLDVLALHLQNASRINLQSPSNKALRMMLRQPSVLDLLEEIVRDAREKERTDAD